MTIPLKYEDVAASLEVANRAKEIAVSLSVDLKAERDAALAHEAALREELDTVRDLHAKQCCVFCNDTGNLRSVHDALQQSLAVAEQRESELEGLVEEGFAAIPSQQGYDGLLGRMLAVLKPSAEVDHGKA